MIEKTVSLALTGHRPHKFLGEYDISHYSYRNLFNELITIIEKVLNNSEKLILISGMALGADTI